MPVAQNLLALAAGALGGRGQRQREEAERGLRQQQLGLQQQGLDLQWFKAQMAAMPPENLAAVQGLAQQYESGDIDWPTFATRMLPYLGQGQQGPTVRALQPEGPSEFTLGGGQKRFRAEPGGPAEQIATGGPKTFAPTGGDQTVFDVPKGEFDRIWKFVSQFSPNALDVETLSAGGVDPLTILMTMQKTGGRMVPEGMKDEYKDSVNWLKSVFKSFYTNQPLGAGAEPTLEITEDGKLVRLR